MKNRFLKKLIAITMAVLMTISLGACNGNAYSANISQSAVETPEEPQFPENNARKIVLTEKTFYQSLESSATVSVAHYENEPEILLIEINNAIKEFYNEFALAAFSSAPATVEETDTTIIITRKNGSYCEIDFVKDTVYFSNFDNFSSKDFCDNPHDLLAYPYVDENGNSVYFKRESSFFTPGYGLEIDLGERNIPLDICDGKKYIPLQTFNDLFISPLGINIVYNGKDIFFMAGNALLPGLEEIYYFEERTSRSTALAEFNFNELCLYLDLYYGLQNEHGFDNGFIYYLESIGLKQKFLELDAVHAFNALGNLTMGYIADGHSTVTTASPYFGAPNPDSEEMDIVISNDIKAQIIAMNKYYELRANMMSTVKSYQKIGNTAYVTIDTFALGDRTGGYSNESQQIDDTVSVIMYAHEQIVKDEEIENVVLDLSCNGGGAVDAAIYVVAWMLGSCELSVYNSITESRATTNYVVDVNMDGTFDKNDSISDKNLYCIVSPVSFSCGNLVPALLKASGCATIIGKRSGGGGCFVRQAVTADGTTFTISSSNQMSTVVNGTYYSVDMGVDPDITLTKLESFYNRNALTEFINSLK